MIKLARTFPPEIRKWASTGMFTVFSTKEGVYIHTDLGRVEDKGYVLVEDVDLDLETGDITYRVTDGEREEAFRASIGEKEYRSLQQLVERFIQR